MILASLYINHYLAVRYAILLDTTYDSTINQIDNSSIRTANKLQSSSIKGKYKAVSGINHENPMCLIYTIYDGYSSTKHHAIL